MSTFKVISSTMGQANPSPVESGIYYRYKGRDGWPSDPATHDKPESQKSAPYTPPGSRAGRLRRFAEARDAGKTRDEAAAIVEITAPTARDYERDYQASKAPQEGGSHG